MARAELAPAQEAAHIARRREIWADLQSGKDFPVESRGEDGRGHRPKEFAAELAEVTGSSKVDINRKLRRARELKDDLDRIDGTVILVLQNRP